MTIRFIQQWNGYSPDQIVSGLGGTEEARMVSLGFATTDLDGPDGSGGEFVRFNQTTGQLERWNAASGAYVPASTSISPTTGLPVIVGPTGTEYPLTRVSVTHLNLSADTSALSNGAVIPWNNIVRDDLGVMGGVASSKIYIPDTVKQIRVSAGLAYKYDAAHTGTFRGLAFGLNVNTAALTVSGLANQRIPRLNINNASEGTPLYTSPLLSTSAWTPGAIPNDNYIEVKTLFDIDATAIIQGTLTNASFLHVEMWE